MSSIATSRPRRNVKAPERFTIDFDDEEEKRLRQEEKAWESGKVVDCENDYFEEDEDEDEEECSEDREFIADDEESVDPEDEDEEEEEPELDDDLEETDEEESELDSDLLEDDDDDGDFEEEEEEEEVASPSLKRKRDDDPEEDAKRTRQEESVYVLFQGPCVNENQIQNYSLIIKFPSQQTCDNLEDAMFDNCIEIFNANLPDGWSLSDQFEWEPVTVDELTAPVIEWVE